MHEAKWLPLNADEIAPSRHPSDASWVEESPSPYDVPTHARSFYDDTTGILTIEFRYMSSERTKELVLSPYIKAVVGKASRRIYAVHLDVHTFSRDRNRMATATKDSICAFDGIRLSNRRAAVNAIDRKQGMLFAALGG
jgi:hypothetical protein